ncbi:MAG TPA: hypothetical protein VN673_18545 [Clostridia bacterium]|nr:hypothetical protein [Clostridia bacterium]
MKRQTNVSFVMQNILQLYRGVVLAFGIIVPTWVLFGPIAGFHHMIACGILAPVVLNGETPQGDRLLWGEFEVRFFPGRFAASLFLWCGAMLLLYWILRRKQNGR